MNSDHETTAVSKESGSTEWNGDGSELTDFTNDFAILKISHFTRHRLITVPGSRIPIHVSFPTPLLAEIINKLGISG